MFALRGQMPSEAGLRGIQTCVLEPFPDKERLRSFFPTAAINKEKNLPEPSRPLPHPEDPNRSPTGALFRYIAFVDQSVENILDIDKPGRYTYLRKAEILRGHRRRDSCPGEGGPRFQRLGGVERPS